MHTRSEARAAELLLRLTPAEAARRMGVSENALRRRLDDPAFQALLGRRLRETREAAERIAASATLAAAIAVSEAVAAGDGHDPPRAAMDILKLSGVLESARSCREADAGLALDEVIQRVREAAGPQAGGEEDAP